MWQLASRWQRIRSLPQADLHNVDSDIVCCFFESEVSGTFLTKMKSILRFFQSSMIDPEEVNLIDSCCQTEVCSVFGALLVVLGCLFSPLKKWWKGLDPKIRGLILVGLSTIIGTLDTCFDWAGKHYQNLSQIPIHFHDSFTSKFIANQSLFFFLGTRYISFY